MKKKFKIIIGFAIIVILIILSIIFICLNHKKEPDAFFVKRKNYYELYNSLGKKLFDSKITFYTPFEKDTSLIFSNNIYYLINSKGKIVKDFKKDSFVEKTGSLYVYNSKKGEKIIYNYRGKKLLENKNFNIEKLSDYSNLYVLSDDKNYFLYNDYGKKLLELKNILDSYIIPNSELRTDDKVYLSFVYRNNTYIYNGKNIKEIENEYKLISLYKDNYVLKDVNDEYRYYIYSNNEISGYFSGLDCNEKSLVIDDNYVLCKDTYNLYKFDGNIFLEGLNTYVDAMKYSYVTTEKDNYVLKIKNGNKERSVIASDAVKTYNDRIIIINDKGKFDIYDYKGNKINDASFKYLEEIPNNNFIAYNNKNSYIIDHNNNIKSIKYKSIANYNDNYLLGYKKNNFDLINQDGNVIVSDINKIYSSSNKFLYFKKDKKYIIYNLNLDKIVYESKKKQKVIIDDNYYIINKKFFFENGKELKN